MIANIFQMEYDRSVLSSLGLNVNSCCNVGKRKRCAINVSTLICDIEEIIEGIIKDDAHAYAELLYCGKIKPYVILNSLVGTDKNRYCPEKVCKRLKKKPEKKQALIQRLQFIQYQLAAAGRLYNLRTA